MYIYKIINTINDKWYIGKHIGTNPEYMGSGKLLKQAYLKYGIENFNKIILEQCDTIEELNIKEIEWISKTNACNDPLSYNLASGGEGGDLSKFIPYDTIDYSNHNMLGAKKWLESLTLDERMAMYKHQGDARAKGWYVSRIINSAETFVLNLNSWCRENNISVKTMYSITNPSHPLYQKQTKGWRARRITDAELPTYENNRNLGHPNIACKGRSWKLVNGIREWYDK